MSATNTQLLEFIKSASSVIVNRLDAINTNLMLIEQKQHAVRVCGELCAQFDDGVVHHRENVYDGSQVTKKPQDIVINNLPSEPDWSKAPEWAEWFAIDGNGSGMWYEEKPILIADRRWWENQSITGRGKWYGAEFCKHNWQNSLRQRPQPWGRDVTALLSTGFDGGLSSEKSFISAYVDLLLARMAKEDRFSDDDCVGEFPAPDAHDVCIYCRDGESEQFAVILAKEISGYSTRLFTWVLGGRKNSFGFFNLDDTDFSSDSESWLRTIAQAEAADFRQAMEVVYG